MTIGMSGYMRVEDMLTARVNELTADLIHEREAHAETQAALRAFIVDLDRANAALILAKEALAALIAHTYDCEIYLNKAFRVESVPLTDARAALDAVNALAEGAKT